MTALLIKYNTTTHTNVRGAFVMRETDFSENERLTGFGFYGAQVSQVEIPDDELPAGNVLVLQSHKASHSAVGMLNHIPYLVPLKEFTAENRRLWYIHYDPLDGYRWKRYKNQDQSLLESHLEYGQFLDNLCPLRGLL